MTVFAPTVFAQGLKTKTSFGEVSNLPQYVGAVLDWLVPAAIFLAIFMIVWAGWDYISSGGDKNKIDAAKARLLGTLAGLALLLLTGFIYRFLI